MRSFIKHVTLWQKDTCPVHVAEHSVLSILILLFLNNTYSHRQYRNRRFKKSPISR